MSKRIPSSLMSLVEDFILKNGNVTRQQIYAAVAHKISNSIAANAARIGLRVDAKRGRNYAKQKRPTDSLLKSGRRIKVNNTLRYLLTSNRIRRISKNVFGPPLPKLFKCDEHTRPFEPTQHTDCPPKSSSL